MNILSLVSAVTILDLNMTFFPLHKGREKKGSQLLIVLVAQHYKDQ
jgi:hypothetical protein